ncbi:type I restriction endonuclease subunit R [Dysgonomonas massiliensis]|uniref:type I restriction endonuclease subunit R n=1 Tax=Dysgonomonas massiliensis TaxID=2040292 RepID=UPI000C76E02C|nr:type I restriction endonuclease subunit R [Dysgonomonas massiliensis]
MTNIQTEAQMETELVKQLEQLGYQYVTIANEADLLANFKLQLERHNKIAPLSDREFDQILNKLQKGSIFDKAKTLRQKMDYTRDDNTVGYIDLIDMFDFCQNTYQVTNQVTIDGKYQNRYDVTILINGLPLVQIELKRRGLELKEAFNQTNRYERHSYGAGYGLFQYIQLFVISNGVNTKYYANSKISARSFEQTFYWTDTLNNQITQLKDFTYQFLDTCHLSKMITKYIVLNESTDTLMVLRPYQYYAVEEIVKRVKESDENGYIWHTTGSGKTLTSFKTSQIITSIPDIAKVVFVVDRKDLDYQTVKEFNSFSKGSIDGTNNTQALVKQFKDPDPQKKLIVTTIQKLDIAISGSRYAKVMERFRDEKVVFIFDECHRSQFGETHRRIRNFFPKAQLFGFTGTPIFPKNAVKNALGKRTTEELFDKCLHKYVITDAIRDNNVLKFSVEYYSTYKKKDNIQDEEVQAIDTAEVLNDPRRLENNVDYILANHNRKTHSRQFTAMMCVSSVPMLIQYYELFKKKQQEGKHNLRVATIFSFQANEEDKEANGMGTVDLDDEFMEEEVAVPYAHSREKLDEYIGDYNKMFGTNFSTNIFYDYYKDIAKKVKSQQVDILLVVNMFLTGFDSKTLNTLYVDKNLKYHGLIQAYSRTNRILNAVKSQGNIVCFRNLKAETDAAIELFANKEAQSIIIMPPYEDFVREFNLALVDFYELVPTADSVSSLADEDTQIAFVKSYRLLMRLMNKLECFSQFTFTDLDIEKQTYEDYKSKYLDLYEDIKVDREKPDKVSILNDINFELELIHRDEINVAYILTLLGRLRESSDEEQATIRKSLMDSLTNTPSMRSKRELIEKFINENLLHLTDEDDLESKFFEFWDEEKLKALNKLSKEEELKEDKLQSVISDYLYTGRTPLRDDLVETMKTRPALKERKSKAEKILAKIKDYVDKFIEGF